MLVQTKLARDGPIMAVLVALVLGCAAQVVFMLTIGKNMVINSHAVYMSEMGIVSFNYVYTAPNTLREAHGDAIAVNIATANNMEANKTMATYMMTTAMAIGAKNVTITTANQTANRNNTEVTKALNAQKEGCLGACLATANTAIAYQPPTTIEGTGGFDAKLATTITGLGVASFG